ncbi:hypothetical protein CUU62_16675 [Pseudomonas sp. WP001]|nr:hypothetical protein CUU62_16675 [Pseudomonas sp. WP001]
MRILVDSSTFPILAVIISKLIHIPRKLLIKPRHIKNLNLTFRMNFKYSCWFIILIAQLIFSSIIDCFGSKKTIKPRFVF